MYSKEKDPQDLQDFMESLGFSSFEDSGVIESLLEKFKGKIVTLKKQGVQVVGKLHSATMIFGAHLNLTEVDEEKSDSNVLKELHYYHPRDYKPQDDPKDDYTNFGFVSATFTESADPKTTDLLVVPIEGCLLECEGEVINLSSLG